MSFQIHLTLDMVPIAKHYRAEKSVHFIVVYQNRWNEFPLDRSFSMANNNDTHSCTRLRMSFAVLASQTLITIAVQTNGNMIFK